MVPDTMVSDPNPAIYKLCDPRQLADLPLSYLQREVTAVPTSLSGKENQTYVKPGVQDMISRNQSKFFLLIYPALPTVL